MGIPRSERLMRIDEYLRAQDEPVTVAALAQLFSVARRTLFRDLAILREDGVLISGSPAPGGGITLIDESSASAQTNPSPDLLVHSLVGREREMADLTSALDGAFVGNGGLIMLVGEPGIGKTRTSQEIANIAAGRGAQVLWGRCYEGQGAPPYWPWIQIIRSYARENEPGHVRSVMGIGATYIADIVTELKELFPDLASSPKLEPLQARFQLFDSITSFLKKASADTPIVLLLDNLHWADRSSLLLVELLLQGLDETKILVIGTYRDEELFRDHPLQLTLGELAKHSKFQRIKLGGLAQEDIRELIEQASGEEPSLELAETVLSKTEGNPFFVTEIVRMFANEEPLNLETAEGTQGVTLRVPDGVKEAIGRRLHPLSADCFKVLTVASVVGREFELDLVKRLVTEFSDELFIEVLDEALSAGIIQEIFNTSGRYQFAHQLILETLSEEFSSVRRAALHGKIGEALEDLYAHDLESHVDELAYHFARAEPVLGGPKLVRYSLLAGERAFAAHAWDEALRHFERGLSMKKTVNMDAEKAALLFGLARSQTGTLERSRVHEAVTTVRPAFDYYVATGDIPAALAVAASPYYSLGENTDLVELFVEALKLVPLESVEAGRLLVRYGNVSSIGMGNFDAAIGAYEQALAIARSNQDATLEMTALNGISIAHMMLRFDPQASLDYCLQSIELGNSAGLVNPQNRDHWWASIALVALGDLESAKPHAAESLAIAEKDGSRFNISMGFFSNEALAHLEGDWEKARDFSDRGLAIDHTDGRLVSNRAILECELGQFDRGYSNIDQLIETMRAAPPAPTVEYSLPAYAIGVTARISANTDYFDIAEAAANIVLASPLPTTFTRHLARTGLALIAVERNDLALATAQYEVLRSPLLPLVGMNLVSGHRVLGLLARTMNRIDNAVTHFEDSLDFCSMAGTRPELAWTAYDYACTLLQCGDSGDHYRVATLVNQALAISTELGMHPLVERVVALQEEVRQLSVGTPEYPVGLTPREVEVLRLVAAGKSNTDIAEELVLSVRTVERHISNIYGKTGSGGRASATAFAFTSGLMSDHTTGK